MSMFGKTLKVVVPLLVGGAAYAKHRKNVHTKLPEEERKLVCKKKLAKEEFGRDIYFTCQNSSDDAESNCAPPRVICKKRLAYRQYGTDRLLFAVSQTSSRDPDSPSQQSPSQEPDDLPCDEEEERENFVFPTSKSSGADDSCPAWETPREREAKEFSERRRSLNNSSDQPAPPSKPPPRSLPPCSDSPSRKKFVCRKRQKMIDSKPPACQHSDQCAEGVTPSKPDSPGGSSCAPQGPFAPKPSPSSSSCAPKNPFSSSCDIKKPSSSSCDIKKPSSSSCDTKKPSSSSCDTKKPSSSSCDTQKPSSSSCDVKKPSSSSCDTKKPSSSSCDIKKPSSSSCDVKKPSSSSCDTKKPSSSSCDTKKPSSSSCDTKKPSSSSCEPDEPPICFLPPPPPPEYHPWPPLTPPPPPPSEPCKPKQAPCADEKKPKRYKSPLDDFDMGKLKFADDGEDSASDEEPLVREKIPPHKQIDHSPSYFDGIVEDEANPCSSCDTKERRKQRDMLAKMRGFPQGCFDDACPPKKPVCKCDDEDEDDLYDVVSKSDGGKVESETPVLVTTDSDEPKPLRHPNYHKNDSSRQQAPQDSADPSIQPFAGDGDTENDSKPSTDGLLKEDDGFDIELVNFPKDEQP